MDVLNSIIEINRLRQEINRFLSKEMRMFLMDVFKGIIG